MPTAGELTIVLQAQDRASAQIRELGQDVQRLERQVDSAARSTSGLGRVFSGIGTGLRAGLGFAAAEAGLQGLHQAFGFIAESVVGMNSQVEQATATFRVFTGSAAEARAIVADLAREADITPFDTREVLAAGQALISSAHGSRDAMMELLRTAEQLAAFRPAQGLEGATFALREALEGDLESIRERFGLSAQSIRNFQAQGMTALQAVRAEMQRVGATSRLVQELAGTFGGLSSNITSAFAEVRRRLGEGLFERLKDGLVALNGALTQNRDAIYEWATRTGAIVAEVAARIGGILGGLAVQLLNWIDPGSGDRLRELFAGVGETVADAGDAAEQAAPQVQALDRALALPQAREALAGARGNLEALQTLAAQTSRPVEQLARDLGAAGLAAAELQFQADRVRDSYQRQLDPLERQLRTLQNSVELQRLQNALASNRSAVERLQLEREIVALQRAAGGATDPAAAGLTARQRAIALALQERELRVQALGLEDERRPIVQELQERLEALNEEQRRALEPIQVQIAAQRERVDLLQLERQRWEGLRGEIQGAIDAVNSAPVQAKTAAPDAAAVETRKQELERIGKEFGERFQKGWTDWLAGADLFTAIGNHLTEWYDTAGKPLAQRLGSDLGTALGDAAGRAFGNRLLPAIRDALGEQAGAGVDALIGALGPTGTALNPTANTREAGAPPRLPRVATGPPPEGAGAAPDQLTGGGAGGQGPAISVVVESGAVQLEPGVDAAALQRAKEATVRAILEAFAAAEAGTDPGPNRLVQGSRGTR